MRALTVLIFLATAVAAPLTGRAAAASLNVSATIPSKSICSFRTATVSLGFGTLDPLNPADIPASVTAYFRCMGSAPTVVYMVSENSGLHNTGPGMNRMRHATDPTAYLPYTITLNPATGSFPREVSPKDHAVTVTGLIRGTDYLTAVPGNYSDTVMLTITP